MRLSKLFGKTQREVPADADTISHKLLVRAGMVNQLAAGIYSYLPLALKVLRKAENIIREEIDSAGGQELQLPVLQPDELWQLSGRGDKMGEVLFTVTDRREHKLVLGPTHEEVITQLVSRYVRSYRDLPLLLYQIQTKFRDETRPRAGLIRAREFPMKDLYSFDTDEAGLEISYQKMVTAYQNIFRRCGLPAMMVEADSGAIGGKGSHEFMLITPNGEDEIIHCPKCGYAANVEKATSIKDSSDIGNPLPLEKIATPGKEAIEEVASFLKIPHRNTLKAVFYVADREFVFVVIRGDLEVNEIKLKNQLAATDLRLATDAEVRGSGIITGAASPVGLSGFKIVADDSITSGSNFVAGGNKPATHLKNVNYPRDFNAEIVADITRTRAGDRCPICGGIFESKQGIEVGHVFKLGTFLSEKLGASFIDEKGESHPILIGCYGIGIGRLLAAAIEQNHDDQGITWPVQIAPYDVYLCPLYKQGSKVAEVCDGLYAELRATGLEVLFDDRKESAGVKFNDADLLGIPLRVTLSARTLEKASLELKWRTEKQTIFIPVDGAAAAIAVEFHKLKAK